MKGKVTQKTPTSPHRLVERLEKQYQHKRRLYQYQQLVDWIKSQFKSDRRKKRKGTHERAAWRKYEYLAK